MKNEGIVGKLNFIKCVNLEIDFFSVKCLEIFLVLGDFLIVVFIEIVK